MGIKIKDVELLKEITGNEKIPVSNGSDQPATITINLILDKVPTKVSLLENDSNYIQEDILTTEFSIKAVSATGELLDLDLADTSCVAVAYRGESCSFIIAKHDVLNGSKFYWGKNLKGYDVPNLNNFNTGGSLQNDLDGDLNTKTIISGYNLLGVEVDNSDMCKGFETYKETYTDWYIPTAAQLLLLFYYINEVNEMFAKIGGTPLNTTDFYWSSTENSANQAWAAKLTNGSVLIKLDKDTLGLLRLVRNIKTIKLRISNLETKVTELENIPEATIETIGGVKKFEIMDLQDKSNIDNLYKAYNTLVEQMVNAGVAEDTRFVDLGLPSGTLWATCNLGSDSIDDPGLFFLWGDIEGYYYKDGLILDQYGKPSDKIFDYAHYKWYDGTTNYRSGTHEGLIKYYVLEDEDGEYIYKLTSLLPEDNAAILYNPLFSFPSGKLVKELLQGCNRTFVTLNNQNLVCFESIYNGNKLYAPIVQNIGNSYAGISDCCFWVLLLDPEYQGSCLVYKFSEGGPTNSVSLVRIDRCDGLPIRYVKKQ